MKRNSVYNSEKMNQNSDKTISDISIENLMEHLKEEDKFLTKLVDSIPAKMYFDQDIQDKISAEKHLFMDQATEDLKRKFNFSELSAKNKHKRSRLDPLCQKSVSQIHEELDMKKERQRKKKKKDVLFPSTTLTRAANIEELQKRLQEKIEMLQSIRKADSDPAKKKKLTHQLKKLKSKKGNLRKIREPEVKTNNNAEVKEKSNPKPIYNKDGKIIYSKLDFAESGFDNVKQNHHKTGKNYKRLLKKAEKKKEKIENLKNMNPEKAQLTAEKEKWKNAILKTEGVKIKDDPALLKKSIKKTEKKKKKSAKAWKERIEQMEKRKTAYQEKRAQNISSRKKDKLQHKIKRAKKKGRVIPGF